MSVFIFLWLSFVSDRHTEDVKNGFFDIDPMIKSLDNPYIGGNWIIVNSSSETNILKTTDRSKPHGCTISGVFKQCDNSDGNDACRAVALTNGYCLVSFNLFCFILARKEQPNKQFLIFFTCTFCGCGVLFAIMSKS